ncbi:ankyrin repeat domain-containing protein [Aspergillus lucknowensis]|uniref:Fungal N-terminal domain-containing protein n=1 Tax=Aspergillus lucknowensis TaxID=176173 RepID=A0ABR4LSI5_9EURO
MAEVLGLISAGIGAAAFALQVSETIRRLRDIREYNHSKAGDELRSLVKRLERLREVLLFLETVQTSKLVDLAVENCQQEYSSVDTTIQRMGEKLSRLSGKKLQSARHGEGIKNQLRDVKRRLDSVILELTCTIALDSQRLTQSLAQDMALVASSSVVNSTMIPNTRRQNSLLRPQETIIAEPPLPHPASVSCLVNPSRRRQVVDCAIRHCHCSCHWTQRRSTPFWAFEYTPLLTFFEKCSNSKCTATRYRWSLQFTLSRYGIPFKVNAAFDFITGAGSYSLRPALSIERVVKYTSPGFEALWRFQRGLLSLREVQATFRELKRCDPSLNRHINPGGRCYVQELLYYGPSQAQADQFKLLKFFACELGMTLEGLDQRFLVQCAKWIGIGPHIDLLEAILAYGFDPSSIESPSYKEWPSLSPPLCPPNWIAECLTPDPFFVDYLAILAKASPGFAGLTPLHEIVLLQPPASVTSFLSRSPLHMERNFLGQTPLHLAVRDVETVRLLVQSGHDMDIQDNHGITPLMYAAGMGITDVVRLLIKQGANPFVRDTTWKRNFIDYAATRGNWPLIMDILDTIQDLYPKKVFHDFICCALMRLLAREVWLGSKWSTYFAKLVGLCSDVNMRFGNPHANTEDNNLLHFISNHDDVKVLVRHGFNMFGQPNSAGKPAIFSLAHILDATLTQHLLGYGINVNHVDHEGRTLLFPLLQQMRWLHPGTFDVMDSIRICLRAGLDIFLSDGCRCPCSPGGCYLPAALDVTFVDTLTPTPVFVWAFEFLSLVEELRGREDAKTLLLGFLRRLYFERAGITHVCCHGGNGIPYWIRLVFGENMSTANVDKILDEEEELIANLENDMLPLTSNPLECLRSDWIFMLRERHQEQLEVKRRKKPTSYKPPTGETYEVDYRNDTFTHTFYGDCDFGVTPLTGAMAEYVIWLEHEYFRSEDTWEATCEREAWYKRRMSWFVELMQVMEVTPETLTQVIVHKIKTISWKKERPDKEHVVNHFMTSLQASRGGGKEKSEGSR